MGKKKIEPLKENDKATKDDLALGYNSTLDETGKGDVNLQNGVREKYWIKNGIAVCHIDYPNIKMRVQQLRKVQKEINDGKGGKKVVEFIAGVSCTWLDKDHKFQTGLFHTKEIQPWKET